MGEVDTIIRAFGPEHIAKLTGVSVATLRYWDRTGFYKPEISGDTPVYTFRDVVSLRTICLLRKEHGVSLQHLRQAAKRLREHRNDPWSQLKLFVLRKRVYFQVPNTKDVQAAVGGQYTIKEIALEVIAKDVARDAEKLNLRSTEKVGHIEQHRNVMRNQPVIAGTRIPTRAIRNFSDAGYSITAIIREYPMLTEADVKAALAYEKKREAA